MSGVVGDDVLVSVIVVELVVESGFVSVVVDDQASRIRFVIGFKAKTLKTSRQTKTTDRTATMTWLDEDAREAESARSELGDGGAGET